MKLLYGFVAAVAIYTICTSGTSTSDMYYKLFQSIFLIIFGAVMGISVGFNLMQEARKEASRNS